MWQFYITVYSKNTHTTDYVEGCYFDGDGVPVCSDTSMAKNFPKFEDAVNYAIIDCKFDLGDFQIEAMYYF